MAIAATNSATPSLQATLNKGRLEQAKREAETAETKVEALQQQTEQAEQEVQAKRENVRELSTRSALEDTTYIGQLRAARSSVAPATQDFLVRMYTATSAQFAASGNALKSSLSARPFINTQGQPTGRIVNLSA
jgi:multidrug efflux pump subunit AcrA (membrane-fusion protein)